MEATVDGEKVVQLTVNSKEYKVEVNANETLLDVLREELGLTGAKNGCDAGSFAIW
jgi:aerobic-type carbon monoxide dehydrogenase small subunit (CoxS/CutS family)